MSPEFTFIVLLGVRMAVAAAFVVSASFIAERAGPAIGALVATLPVSAGPAYVFLALDHDAAFIAQGALASLPINAATVFLGLVYVLLAQRQNVLVSCSVAVATWFALAALMRALNLSLAGGLIANAAAFAICVPALQRFRHVRMPLITRRWYDIPLRALYGRRAGGNRGRAVGLGGTLDHRNPGAVSGGVHQPDADPAPADRWTCDRGRDRQ